MKPAERIIETLIYTNELGESLTFSHTSVYCPQTTDGLADVRNTIFSIHSMGQDGDTYIGGRIESRNIDIAGQIKERDPEKMRAARRTLARVLNPQLSATLTYRFGDFVRVIACRAVNAPMVKKPLQALYASFDVHLACHNPYWREENDHRDDIAAWVGAFEFPVEIPEAGMEMGYRQPSLIVNVFNGGDVKTCVRIEFRALGVVRNPSITMVDSRENVKLNLAMQEGDVLTLSTGYAEKWARLFRDGATSDALQYVDIDSEFVQIQPGDNLVRYDAEEGLENLEVSIFHRNLFLSV